MKHTLPRYLLAGLCALAFSFVSATAFAQGGADKKPKEPSKADLKKYDANADGVLDDAELATMKADKDAKKAADKQARLDKYDKNKDGKIDKQEAEAEKADKEAAKAAKAEKKMKDDAKKADRAKEKSKSKN